MIMYAVVHKEHAESASVKLMGNTRKQAITLWEHWNKAANVEFDDYHKKNGWKVIKYTVELR